MDPSDIKEDTDQFYGGNEVRADADDEDEEHLIVEMDNIHKTYLLGIEGVPALRGVSLSVKKGEFIVVFGLSGGGKTTLLNVAGTIDKPTKGEMRLCGVRIDSRTEDSVFSQLRLKKIGFVFQTFNLLSSLTALENVEMPMILDGTLSAAERRQRAISLLEKVGMGGRLNHMPSQLSGGEQQRVTIARSIANNPELLLLDEPTGDLDTLNTCIAMKLLTDLNKSQKITLLMVTHDVGLKNFADRVVWMRDGKIVRVETVHPKKRAERYEELDAELERLQKGQKKLAKIRPPGMNTVIRQPEDYVTHVNHVHREPELYVFDKMKNMTQEEYERSTGLIRDGSSEELQQQQARRPSSTSSDLIIDIDHVGDSAEETTLHESDDGLMPLNSAPSTYSPLAGKIKQKSGAAGRLELRDM